MEMDKDNTNKDMQDKGHEISAFKTVAKPFTGQGISTNWAQNIHMHIPKHIARKVDKIVAATYMVTNYMPDSEILKKSIRECSNKLISTTYSGEVQLADGCDVRYRRAVSIIGEVLSFIFVSYSINLVSEMNYKILKREYEQLAIDIESTSKRMSLLEEDNRAISENHFDSEEGGLPEQLPDENVSSTRDYKGQNVITDRHAGRMSVITKDSRVSIATSATRRKDFSVPQVKNDRRDNILSIIRKKKRDVTIKDISRLIYGCSEKTIQRELLALVSSGVLKKEGEKRWSRYSLK